MLSFTSAELDEDLEVTGPVSVTLHAGTSAADTNFFDRNPGDGAPAAAATAENLVTAEQTIFHNGSRPSRVTLPVIPRTADPWP
jgi:predicted acyl esterase